MLLFSAPRSLTVPTWTPSSSSFFAVRLFKLLAYFQGPHIYCLLRLHIRNSLSHRLESFGALCRYWRCLSGTYCEGHAAQCRCDGLSRGHFIFCLTRYHLYLRPCFEELLRVYPCLVSQSFGWGRVKTEYHMPLAHTSNADRTSPGSLDIYPYIERQNHCAEHWHPTFLLSDRHDRADVQLRSKL